MRDITLTRAAFHWKGPALASGFRIFVYGNGSRVERLVDLRIDRGQPAVDATKKAPFRARRGPPHCRHDQTVGVDEIDRGARPSRISANVAASPG